MSKFPTEISNGGNNCHAYVKQFVSWHTNYRDREVCEISSIDIMTILKYRPSEKCHTFTLFKQAFASFKDHFLKSETFDDNLYYLDTTAHTRAEFEAICTDQKVKEDLLDRDNKNIAWHGSDKDFKPLIFLFCGGKYWDWAYEDTFELVASPRSYRLTVVFEGI